MALVRPEQLGWGLTQDLAITASGTYFTFEEDGNVTLDFNTIEGNAFSIRNSSSVIFSVQDDGQATVQNLTVTGWITGNVLFTGSIERAVTASHLEEQGVALFSPISTPNYQITGGFFRSSSGDWFLS